MRDDRERLRAAYAERQRRFAHTDKYSLFNRANLFTWQQRQRRVLDALQRVDLHPIEDKRILEVGCGGGGVLNEYLAYGAEPSRLFGIDLLADRVKRAHRRLAHLPIAVADGQQLPFRSGVFDLVVQYTAFSSILDAGIKQRVAHEMQRVLHKSGGAILWYDFWLNPTNKQTQGIRLDEIRQLFIGYTLHAERITLAPPITRRLVRLSWLLCAALENLRILNSHYLVIITHP
jgi:ubiquinone/menaquinone biosynthesis C-methylase UbiE